MDVPAAHALETDSLRKQIGSSVIISGVTVAIPAGSRVGLVGPNGAGKTSLLKLCAGLWRPTRGTVRVFGEAVGIDGPGRRRVGVVFEDVRLYPFWTGRDHVMAAARMHRMGGQEALDRVTQLLDLGPFVGQRTGRLSLGQRQRIALARSLVSQPDLLLLDEPTNGLDPDGIMELRALLDRLAAEAGTTVLVSSHGLMELARMVRRVLFLRKGQVVADEQVEGPPGALEARWRTLYARS
jgi:ABC-2 type transport system ATP-binding protein